MFGFTKKRDMLSASLRADAIKEAFSESSHRLKLPFDAWLAFSKPV